MLMKHIKLFEEYSDNPFKENEEQLISLLKSCTEESIELVYNMVSSVEGYFEELVQETFNMVWFDKRLNLRRNSIKEKVILLVKLPSLDFVKNNLTEIPKEIGNLNNLISLDLSKNFIEEIPKEICNLNSLTSLDLTNNYIKNIPKEIGNLNNLEVLGLSSNDITIVPKEIGNLNNLKVLDLSYNNIIEIPKEIGNLKLEGLYLGANKLNKETIDYLNFLNIEEVEI
jgi:Leucine-rich repeat (LRR) protein